SIRAASPGGALLITLSRRAAECRKQSRTTTQSSSFALVAFNTEMKGSVGLRRRPLIVSARRPRQIRRWPIPHSVGSSTTRFLGELRRAGDNRTDCGDGGKELQQRS